MNYNVDHNLLQLEVFKDLKHNHTIATLLILSAIIHFTKTDVGYMDFYQSKFAKDTGIGVKTIRLAEKRLLDAGLIKLVRAYQKVGNLPNRYVATRLGIGLTKVRHSMKKGIASDAKVNNSKKNYNSDNDSFKKNQSQFKLKTKGTAWEHNN